MTNFLQISPIFSLMFLFSSRIPSRIPHCTQLSCLLRLPPSVTVSQSFKTLTTLKNTGWYLIECPSILICRMFSHQTGVMGFKEYQISEMPFLSHHIKKCMVSAYSVFRREIQEDNSVDSSLSMCGCFQYVLVLMGVTNSCSQFSFFLPKSHLNFVQGNGAQVKNILLPRFPCR